MLLPDRATGFLMKGIGSDRPSAKDAQEEHDDDQHMPHKEAQNRQLGSTLARIRISHVDHLLSIWIVCCA
jgi:hypothetical protein